MYFDGTNVMIRKYYAFAGMTISMDDGSGLKYFLTDHLGSVVVVTDASGALLSEQRYMPFGQARTDCIREPGTPILNCQKKHGMCFQRPGISLLKP